ncbi:MAG: hypothetical protein J6M95_01650 [Bacilli bacterium]|nr:hypothetical protein [Bacilli bacterium]
MKKNSKMIIAFTTLSATALLVSAIGSASTSQVFGQYSPATAGTWVHYETSLPGSAAVAGAPNRYGVREYWVQCGGGYQFTKPDVDDSLIKEGGTNYDFSEFRPDGWEARLIIPVNEQSGTFGSVLYDITSEAGTFSEINNMKGHAYTAASELPSAGEKKKVLWLDNNGNRPSFYADTLGATKVFNTYNEFKDVFKSSSGTKYSENEFLDGYYVLGNDLEININPQASSDLMWTETTNRGFSGTLDGRGHTIDGAKVGFYNGGLFELLTGAIIRNITFDNVKLLNYCATTIANQAHDSILSNITINLLQNAPTEKNFGSVISRYSQNNLIEDVTITATSGVNPTCLFGTAGDNLTNAYDNVVFKGDTEAPVAVKDNTYGISVNQKGYQFVPNSSTLISRERQDIYVNSQDSISLNVGSTNVGTVSSISVKVGLSTYDLGTSLTGLVIPLALKDTPANHGQGLVTITNSEENTFALPVTLVTEYLSTVADLAKIRGTNLASKVYGYYALNNDIIVDYAASGIGATQDTDWNTTTGNGFYGELDGRNFRLRGNVSAASNGIISAAREDAVIKNLTIENSGNTGYGNTSFINGSSGLNVLHLIKVYNITVNAPLVGTNSDHSNVLVKKYVNNIQFMNVVVNTNAGTGVDASGFTVTLFPANYLNENKRFNHVIWNTTSAAATTQVISGKNAVPYGVNINYIN